MQVKSDMSRETTVSRQSMRAFLSALEDAGDLVTIPQPVDLDYEIAACLAEAAGGPALRFSHVRRRADVHAMPVVGNLLNSLPRFAAALRGGTEPMQASLIAAIEKPLPHRVVASAPCQQDIIAEPVAGRRTADPAFL